MKHDINKPMLAKAVRSMDDETLAQMFIDWIGGDKAYVLLSLVNDSRSTRSAASAVDVPETTARRLVDRARRKVSMVCGEVAGE